MACSPVSLQDERASALEALLADSYAELRTIARRVLRADGDELNIQPTDLAHEAALRVMALDRMAYSDRTHFLALSATVMRQALLDEVRRHKARKRRPPTVSTLWGDGRTTWTLPLEELDDALRRLATHDAVRARVVELRFYAGLSMTEIATVTQTSLSTVERQWRTARAWLIAELNPAGL
jgi:RNA polymerase sigma factor (TIGR02999 family)